MEDAKYTARIQTLQATVFAIDKQIQTLIKTITERGGVIAGLRLAMGKIESEAIPPVQAQIDAQKLEIGAGKLIIQGMKQVREVLERASKAQEGDLVTLRGKMLGMEESIKLCQSLADAEEAKQKRREREAQEDGRDPSGRPEQLNPKPEPVEIVDASPAPEPNNVVAITKEAAKAPKIRPSRKRKENVKGKGKGKKDKGTKK